MPELPRGRNGPDRLAPVLTGARIDRASIFDPRLVRPLSPELVADELVGERVRGVDRRGKYLIVWFESGRSLLVHLRMTGSLRTAPTGSLPDDRHRRAVLGLDNGSDVAYRDVRRFGTWELLEAGELAPYLARRLGPEPLGPLTAKRLGERLVGRRTSLKAALLDQRTVAGLGNIYVDEALWYARLHPLRAAGSLDQVEPQRLLRGIRRALRLGLARQGASLRDYSGTGRRIWVDAGRVSRLRACGRAV